MEKTLQLILEQLQQLNNRVDEIKGIVTALRESQEGANAELKNHIIY